MATDIVGKRKRGRPRKYLDTRISHVPTSKPLVRLPDAENISNIFMSTPMNPICPICNGQIPGDEPDAAAHVDECLTRQKEPRPVAKLVTLEDAPVNILDGDESRYGRPQYTDRDIASVLSSISASIDGGAEAPFGRDSMQALVRTVQLQDQIIQRIPRCLICLEPHRIPLVSTVCWHVFCESCWLQSLLIKRVCPHCSSITSPEDLRRIFL